MTPDLMEEGARRAAAHTAAPGRGPVARRHARIGTGAARAFFHQVGGHAAFLHFFARPTTPSGRNSVTAMNSAPRK